jgi:hypothetical protein
MALLSHQIPRGEAYSYLIENKASRNGMEEKG